MAYNLLAIRNLLNDAFSSGGIKTLAFDRFHEVYNNFSSGMTKGQMVEAVVGYADKNKCIPNLLGYVDAKNPYQYLLYVNKNVPSTLPPQPYFFGREKELASIAQAISPEARTWGALIDGPGGIGKTALAIRAGHLAPASDFDRKIFLSSKIRDLTPKGEQSLEDFTVPNYMELLAELAREMGMDTISQRPANERANALRRALADVRILIIIDNLETFDERDRIRLYQFLSRLPLSCKAIVTSRRRSDIDARIVRLDRLAREDAFKLMDELAKNNHRLRKTTVADRDELYAITNGNPLLIRWLAGQLGRTGSKYHTIAQACAFLEKAPRGNDPLEYIFGDLLDTFTESEVSVLTSLVHFSQPTKVAWIANVADISKESARTALEDLTDRALLIADAAMETFFLPPLVATFLRRKYPENIIKAGDRLTDNLYSFNYNQQIRDLQRHINREADLLDAYEEMLSYESDPRRLQNINYEIKRQKETIVGYNEEISRIQAALPTPPTSDINAVQKQLNDISQEITTINEQIINAENRLADEQERIREDSHQQRKTILAYVNEDYRETTAILVNKMNHNELESTESILDAADQQQIAKWQAQQLTILTEQALTYLHRNQPDIAEWESFLEALANETEWEQKLKLAAPSIPSILEFGSEMDMDIVPALRQAWLALVKNINRSDIEQS